MQLREKTDALVATTAALGMEQQATIDRTVMAAGFDKSFSTLMQNSGVEMDSLLDDSGLVDLTKVNAAIVKTAQAYGLRPRTGPKPTPGQGQPGGVGGTSTWGEVFEQATRR